MERWWRWGGGRRDGRCRGEGARGVEEGKEAEA